ncbi:MAG: dihydroneopterin aldolase [Pseudomonadota bacterium]
MRDRIFLRDLRVDTIIGIFDWERTTRQTVCIDLVMPGDIRRAASRDHIDDTLNYKAVAEGVVALVSDASFQLVETMAERIAELCMGEFAMPWIEVSVNKPGAVEGAKDVGVHIRRGALDSEGPQSVYVGLSSNSDPGPRLAGALAALAARFAGVSRSTIYENPDVTGGGPPYWNMVAGFRTSASPEEVRAALRDIAETAAGGAGKRSLGLRLLLHGDTVGPALPHTDLERYAFLLRPLAELIGHCGHPITGERWSRVWSHAGLNAHPMQPVDLPVDGPAY